MYEFITLCWVAQLILKLFKCLQGLGFRQLPSPFIFSGSGAKALSARGGLYNCEEHEEWIGEVSQNRARVAAAQRGECFSQVRRRKWSCLLEIIYIMFTIPACLLKLLKFVYESRLLILIPYLQESQSFFFTPFLTYIHSHVFMLVLLHYCCYMIYCVSSVTRRWDIWFSVTSRIRYVPRKCSSFFFQRNEGKQRITQRGGRGTSQEARTLWETSGRTGSFGIRQGGETLKMHYTFGRWVMFLLLADFS